MIIIATNNGKHYLLDLLSDLERFEVKYEISVIDTQSSDQESLNFLEELKNNNPYNLKINVYQTPYRGFDTGAYIYAINNFNSDVFYFMQDSMRIKTSNYFEAINNTLNEGNVASLLSFAPGFWDNQEQKDFCDRCFESTDYDSGIFGPIFSVRREHIEKIDKKYLIYPSNKLEQMAMERGWSILFKKYGIPIKSIQGEHNRDMLFMDSYDMFQKKLPYRY